jgi:hypothetical protein
MLSTSSLSSPQRTPQKPVALAAAAPKGVVSPRTASSPASTSTPARGSATSTPARGAATSTPARGAATSTPSRAASSASHPAAPQLRGLAGPQPLLWALLGFEPEGQAALTEEQSSTLELIAEHYDLPSGQSIGPLSGMSGEERVLAAYQNGRLRLKAGHTAPPPTCSMCFGEHLASACPRRLKKSKLSQ